MVLWTSGCTLHCPNCQNPQTWDFNSGMPLDTYAVSLLWESLAKPYISGLTITGGHPLESENICKVADLVSAVRAYFPSKTIWIYTGYTWEYLVNLLDYTVALSNILKNIDVIVDGRYIDELRDVALPFRGSSNQRIIDVKQSLELNNIVLWNGNNE